MNATNESMHHSGVGAKTRPLVVLDAFCGAGGSSTGARAALSARGLRHRLIAINHWDVAISTHEKNHPDAKHVRANVYRQDPRELVPDGKVDLFIASPTCSTFSRAKGGRPISWDQRYGRMTPTQVVRWCSLLDVKCLLIENVPEFVEWGPCMRVSEQREGDLFDDKPEWKPNPAKKGKLFRAWIRRLERLGFKVEHRILNAADFGDATTRKRFFLLARRDGKPIQWPTPSHARDGAAGKKRWRPAREIIDWSIVGGSLLRRKRQLKKKTLQRIKSGAERFAWPAPFVELLRRLIDGEPIDGAPLPALPNGVIPKPLGIRFGRVVGPDGAHRLRPDIAPFVFGNRENNVPRAVDQPVPGATTATGGGLAFVEPFVLNRHGENGSRRSRARSTSEPLPTATGAGAGYLLDPILLPQFTDSRARSVDSPVPPLVTVARVGLVEPFQVVLRQNADGKSINEPMPALCANGNHVGLVEPLVLGQHGGAVARPTSEPVPTIATEGAIALIAPYYSESKPSSVEAPLPTVTTKDRFALVAPVTHADASRRARSVDDPLPTVTGARRGELAVIVGAFGEREGQAPRVHSIDQPAPTICASGRVPLAEGVLEGDLLGEVYIDILFRMLEPDELAAATGFPPDYVWPETKTDATKLVGNAVCIGVARALTDALVGVG